MRTLHVQMFGTFRCWWEPGGESVQIIPSVAQVLAYLLLYPNRRHRREALADLFWPSRSSADARRCLNTALWRIRTALKADDDENACCIMSSGTSVWWNPQTPSRVDLWELQAAANLGRDATVLSEEQVAFLERAVAEYSDDLLGTIYEDWVIAPRERNRNRNIRILYWLMKHYRSQACFDKSIYYGLEILARDPLREHVHNELIELYLQKGDSAGAYRQLEVCRALLRSELNIEPQAQTGALLKESADNNAPYGGVKSRGDPGGGHTELTRLANRLQRVNEELTRLQVTLAQVINHLTAEAKS